VSAAGVPANRLQLADLYKHVIFNFPRNNNWIGEIRESDTIYA
jgi:hypothetical protein